ncbi:MAG TPA: lysophospholipid acyltransferase family protein [Bacteroidia bacterium]|jgi:1-acyl-sn-glycerol-3-phosphate acyltransferase
MLYAILKLLMRGTTQVFFRSITIKNKDAVPARGPVIILANHPSTFMDPIVIASVLNRKVFFLGKGELFRGAFAKWLLPKLNIIPVYRKQDDPALMSKNADTFNKCFEHLESGGAILIFPEGVSITERKLKPIKTGAARIALGAEARNGFRLGVKIVNIGLNYADPHKFSRDLFINIEKPIEANSYAGDFLADEFGAAEKLTEEIRQQLEGVVISIQDSKTDQLVKDIETLYKYDLKKARGASVKDTASDFAITRNIIRAVNHFSETDPEFVEAMRSRIKAYLDSLKELNIEDEDISRNRTNRSFLGTNLRALLFVLTGFPVYLYGLFNNFIPFEIPGLVAGKIAKSKDFRGAIGMVLGMFTFLIFYTVQIWLADHLFRNTVITVLYALSLPLSGFFTYYYWHTFDKIRAKWMLISLFFRRSTAIASRIAERENIIQEFDKRRTEFLVKFPDAISTNL